MEKKKLIIVGNEVPRDWEFQSGIQDATGCPWHVKQCITNKYGGLAKVTRYFKYFLLPIQVFIQRGRYSDILSRDQVFGLVLAFYCRLCHVKSAPAIHVMTFIYKRKRGWVGKVYEWFVKMAVSSRYVRHIFVFGKSEIDYYAELFGINRDLFTAEILGIKDSGAEFPLLGEFPSSFYAAAGRSNRDYGFIRSAWPQDQDPIYIISDMEKADDTSNIRYKKNCFGDEYLGILAHSRAVIVPLADAHISSGQLVVLHAAMVGKPVIITRNDTVSDYVEEGVNGLIIEKTMRALEEALKKLEDQGLYDRMCADARRKFELDFSLYQLGRRMGEKMLRDGLGAISSGRV